MPESNSAFLLVTLGTNPELHWCAEEPRDEVELSGVKYALFNREVGFYDFLRSADGEIIGIRFSPFDVHPLIDYAAALSYTRADRKRGYVEIYFRDGTGPAVVGIAEQAFGDDALWRSVSGTYALQVGTSELAEGELAMLRELVRSGE
jgi:hypothetical protein